MTDEQLAALLGDHLDNIERRVIERVDQHVATLRADLMEKLLHLRAPNYNGNKRGELFIDGKMVIDFAPLFREIVNEAVAEALPKVAS